MDLKNSSNFDVGFNLPTEMAELYPIDPECDVLDSDLLSVDVDSLIPIPDFVHGASICYTVLCVHIVL